MKAHQIMQRLLDGGRVPLGAWLADPQGEPQAGRWLWRIQRRLRTVPGPDGVAFSTRLAEIIARYWCGREPLMHYQSLLAVLASDRDRAQLELGYGQLLMARKRQGAWLHLERGFALAANLLEADEYFVVLNRHGSLRHLALSPAGAEPACLDGLLTEAAVIRALRGHGRGRGCATASRHLDTVD